MSSRGIFTTPAAAREATCKLSARSVWPDSIGPQHKPYAIGTDKDILDLEWVCPFLSHMSPGHNGYVMAIVCVIFYIVTACM